ncbi:MAG: TadE/TadG family type IV pilus assembly protein [Candidatus Hydrothermales bacterium]
MKKIKRLRRGAFLVEFAIILPILLLLVAWIYMLGYILHKKQVVTIAARAGAQYAVTPDPVYGNQMATMGVFIPLSGGKGQKVREIVKDVLKRNGLNPDKANISINWFSLPFTLKEENVQNPGYRGRATVHAMYTDMIGGDNCDTRCHSMLVRQELENEFDRDERYRYTKYSISSDVWIVNVRVEYPVGAPLLDLINPILRAAGFKGDLKERKVVANCAFPAPMPLVHVILKTPPLRKAVFDISTYFK